MERNQNLVIYQLALRSFTPEGTLNAAKRLLPHVASLGVDVVYLTPFCRADDDADRATWSERQIASKTENPKNPYKIVDYFQVDEEYGTNEDLNAFVQEAHRCGLRVIFDLVYLHCGKNAVFIKAHPDFVVRNADGSILLPDRWPFARLNFASDGLRDYLYQNMQQFLTEYHVDGFRCDVGDDVPLDFWQAAFSKLKELYPPLITLNEGIKPEYLETAFDMGYSFEWNTLMTEAFTGKAPASVIRELSARERETYGANVANLIRTIETHDTATDCGRNRNQILMTDRGVEAALVVTSTFEGIAFLWNGYEFGDDAENNMFSNRDYGRRSCIDWSKGFTADGARRMEFIRKLFRLRHESEALLCGEMVWVEHNAPAQVIAYIRKTERQTLLIAVNTRNCPVQVTLEITIRQPKPLLQSGAGIDRIIQLEPYGYCIAEIV